MPAINPDNITNAITNLRRDLNKEVLRREELDKEVEELQNGRKKDRTYLHKMLQLTKKQRRQNQIKL